MSPLQELLAEVRQVGRVRWIGVRPKAREAMLEVEAVEARREAGPVSYTHLDVYKRQDTN